MNYKSSGALASSAKGHMYPVEKHLGKLYIHKSTGSDEMLPQMLRKLANIIDSHSLSSLKGRGNQERCLQIGKKQMLFQSSKKGKN